jgi:hypothetical protein
MDASVAKKSRVTPKVNQTFWAAIFRSNFNALDRSSALQIMPHR